MSELTRPLSPSAVHVVIDMQRLFLEGAAWGSRNTQTLVAPILRLLRHRPSAAVFTRFITPRRKEDAPGSWSYFYDHWPSVLQDNMDPALLDLVPEFLGFVPPGEVADKFTYSAFADGDFPGRLRRRGADTLIFSGVETDVCVLLTALDAVDRGYRVVIATDAVGSTVDKAHEATLDHVYPRFDKQIELASVAEIMAAWSPAEGKA
ncbi:cysteine hydrolase family protein [Hypericibacter sp.]|uniref:cysteine hydrolase family protein n=1 Tax=Hypericibacter sp. TaxID=2705401 RepID=UPI003D6C7B1A